MTNQVSVWKIATSITVAGSILLLILYVVLSRYYSSQELAMLVDGATANGQDYSATIHNQLTGSYSFSAQ